MIRRLLPDMYMFVPCVGEKEDNPPKLAKLRPCQGNDCTKMLTSRGCDHAPAKNANLSLDLFSLNMRIVVQNNIQQGTVDFDAAVVWLIPLSQVRLYVVDALGRWVDPDWRGQRASRHPVAFRSLFFVDGALAFLFGHPSEDCPA